jgi:hypothetical protein
MIGRQVEQASTVEQVVARLASLGARLPSGDGVAVFTRMYLAVTREMLDRLAGPFFGDPAAVADLDVLFAGRYLAAVDADLAGQRLPACWRPLFELRTRTGIHPVQYALAGMNAHIEHDLPLAVVDTCRLLDCSPDDLSADYHRVNDVLADVEAQVREQLMPGRDPLEAADPLVHLAGAWSIDRARDAAWASTQALWGLRHLPAVYGGLSATLDAATGMTGRFLLTPLAGAG